MKKLACELCGSTDIIKSEGTFTCQSCGAKYSLEEAKKLLREIDDMPDEAELTEPKPSQVKSSKPKIRLHKGAANNQNAELENYLKVARRARDNGNSETAAKYYEMALVFDPDNWEMIFFLDLYKAMDADLEDQPAACEKMYFTLEDVVNRIAALDDEDEQADAICVVANYTGKLASMVYNAIATVEPYDKIVRKPHQDWYEESMLESTGQMHFLQEQISDVFPGRFDELLIGLLQNGIQMFEHAIMYYNEKTSPKQYLRQYQLKLHEMDPSYVVPSALPLRHDQGKGCYIATAIYESYDCPEVWMLRRFRDNTLDTPWYGRLFIRFYYAISPTLVKYFGTSAGFRSVFS